MDRHPAAIPDNAQVGVLAHELFGRTSDYFCTHRRGPIRSGSASHSLAYFLRGKLIRTLLHDILILKPGTSHASVITIRARLLLILLGVGPYVHPVEERTNDAGRSIRQATSP